MRPMLERIDFTVRHLASIVGDLDELQQNKELERSVEYGQGPKELFGRSFNSKETNAQLLIPEFSYNIIDCCLDFKNNLISDGYP